MLLHPRAHYIGPTLFANGGLQHDQIVNTYDAMSQFIDQDTQACVTPANPCASWARTRTLGMILDGSTGLPYQVYDGGSTLHSPYVPYGDFINTYDYSGNLQYVRDSNHSSNNIVYSYDFLHRILTEQDYLAGAWPQVSYSYDAADHVSSVTDQNGNVARYTYNDFGDLRQEVSAISGTASYAYDPAGNLTGMTDPNGAITTITYDALDRPLTLVATRGSATDNVAWTYDDPTSGHYGVGRLATMSDPTGSTSYTYERRGLLAGETRTIQSYVYTLSYGYDNNGNRNSITYPDGNVINYTFDYADRPFSASSGSTTLVSAATYQPFGPLASLSLGNGATQTLSYEPTRYLPAENKLVNSSGVNIADYAYAEDNIGNITQIHDAVNSGYNRDFSFDDLDRLTTANSGASLWGTATGNGYAYDSMGNVTSVQLGSGRTATFSYVGTTPKLSSVTENGAPRSVAYDSAGNESTVGAASYTYSPRNLLATADNLNYAYDGQGIRRVTTTTTGKRFSFVSPEFRTLAESAVTSSGRPSIAYDYVWLGDRPVAQLDSSGTHYTFADHLGTPEIQMDGSASISWQAEYEPYGKVWALRANDVHQPLRFPGQVAEQFDTGANGATERSYNVFRWYKPAWGRYTQPDPIGLSGGFNRYGYTNNNPIGGYDTSGLWVLLVVRPTHVPPPWMGYSHAYLLLIPEEPLDFLNDPNFYDNGVFMGYTTISGDLAGLPYIGPLNSRPGMDRLAGGNYAVTLPPIGCLSDSQFIRYLELFENSYRNDALTYLVTRQNSNSFIHGLLDAAGVPIPVGFPGYTSPSGWGQPLPNSAFPVPAPRTGPMRPQP